MQGDDPTITISDEVQKKYPEIIELILGSESMNYEERQYWINILGIMTTDQIENLKDILVNEKEQLAIIDKKYAKSTQENIPSIKEIGEERKSRRDKHTENEGKFEQEDTAQEEDILRQIEES